MLVWPSVLCININSVVNIPAQAYKIRTDRYFKRTVYLFLFLEQIQNLPNLCSKNGSAELLDFHNFGANFTKNVIQNLNFAVKMELWYQFFFSQYLFLRLRTVSQNIKQKNKFGAENGTVLNLKTLFEYRHYFSKLQNLSYITLH